MSAFAGELSFALLALLVQAPGPAIDLPLANDAAFGFDAALALEFAQADELATATALPPTALDAWQRALELGAARPGALVPFPAARGGDARGGESAESALLGRLAARGEAGWRAWRARFEDLAREELDRQRREEPALERFLAAHAGTESAVRAALCLSDLARERGDESGAAAALTRARRHGPLSSELQAALARREGAVERPLQPGERAPRLEERSRLVLDVRGAGSRWIRTRRGGSALASLGAGRLAWASAEDLRVVEADGSAQLVEVAELAGDPSWSWGAAFRDEWVPWSPALATRGARLFAMLGRAHAEQGNRVAALDLERGQPARLVWSWDERGHLLPEPAASAALPSGLWEYQPGALATGNTLVVLARRFPELEGDTPVVDELRAETWCLGLRLADGSLEWSRWLARAADPAARERERRPEARGWCTPAEPLAIAAGRIWASNGHGCLAALELPGGRLAEVRRAGLEAELEQRRGLRIAPLAAGAELLWQPWPSRFDYRLGAEGAMTIAPRARGLCVARSAEREWYLQPGEQGWRLEAVECSSGKRARSVELARGEEPAAVAPLGAELGLATPRALYVFGGVDGVRLSTRLELPAEAADAPPGSGALWVGEGELACALGRTLVRWTVR